MKDGGRLVTLSLLQAIVACTPAPERAPTPWRLDSGAPQEADEPDIRKPQPFADLAEPGRTDSGRPADATAHDGLADPDGPSDLKSADHVETCHEIEQEMLDWIARNRTCGTTMDCALHRYVGPLITDAVVGLNSPCCEYVTLNKDADLLHWFDLKQRWDTLDSSIGDCVLRFLPCPDAVCQEEPLPSCEGGTCTF